MYRPKICLWPCPRHMILALGFPKGGGRVPAPCFIVSSHGSMLIGVNTHDTDTTVRPMGVMMLWPCSKCGGQTTQPLCSVTGHKLGPLIANCCGVILVNWFGAQMSPGSSADRWFKIIFHTKCTSGVLINRCSNVTWFISLTLIQNNFPHKMHKWGIV